MFLKKTWPSPGVGEKSRVNETWAARLRRKIVSSRIDDGELALRGGIRQPGLYSHTPFCRADGGGRGAGMIPAHNRLILASLQWQ